MAEQWQRFSRGHKEALQGHVISLFGGVFQMTSYLKGISKMKQNFAEFGRAIAWFLPLLAFAMLSTASRVALSQNLGFMPGDSFFVFELTQELVDSLGENGKSVTLGYPLRLSLIDPAVLS